MPEFALWKLGVLAAAGCLSGYVNTIAGGGSFLTIPLLIFMGLPPTVANATNRLCVFLQALTAVRQFHGYGVFPVRLALLLAGPAVLGSVVGSYAALMVSDASFKKYLAAFMVLMTLTTFIKPPSRKVEGADGMGQKLLAAGLFFLVGVYGGFLQAGVGFLIIAALVFTGQDFVGGNAIKSFVIFALTVVSLLVFFAGGKVELVPGLALGAGSVIGAALGSRATVKRGNLFVQRFVVVTVILSAIWLLFS
ncbi:MAG: sulfite exporter TauE/SafE family protein [Thermodesulfobacteriota bacterium]